SSRIGVDIGGTFTDVALVEEATGRIAVTKLLTTPRDFGEAVLAGLGAALAGEGIAADAVTLLAHATTVVTNALLEHKGAPAAFVATRGFRDILELRRSSRADLYDLLQDPPAVLIPRRHRFEITERIGAAGEVVTPLAKAEIPALAAAIRATGVPSVAICLMFAFLNDAHEQALGAALRAALPEVRVFLSSEVLPEIREFERASTTAVCAVVGPVLQSYLARLEQAVAALGLPNLQVMGSSGGVMDAATALAMPAAAVESGPAAGVIAASRAGAQLGRPNLLSFDMGGTTAKASLIAGGAIPLTAEYEVGGAGHANRWMHGTGHPIRVPVIDLAEVSAGGGSIAWIDPGGALKVGPRSAGAEPGPVAYGRGGTHPTVTDAAVALGWLDGTALLGGALPIDRAGAEAAIARDIGTPLGLDARAAAARIAEVVHANMAQALRIVSVERGHDPAEFALIAFGGAGPVHAAFLAEELAIPEVIVPPAPGAFSALGLVATDLRRDWSRTLYAALDTLEPERLAALIGAMEARGTAFLDGAAIPPARRALRREADLRYRRQAYELTVPVADGAVTAATIARLIADFHAAHERAYGHANPAEPVQLVNLRLSAIGRQNAVTLREHHDPAAARTRAREAWFPGAGVITVPVHWRAGLAPGATLAGPAVVEQLDSTVLIPPGWIARVDENGFIGMRRA
ncbi:MAG: hydantoinase/oxoprolinase family protein, partial [Rhodospirillales bacterium]|nr:hydantoinase/oxoprolinase family protein [Rhodospirillales bacterium]